MLMSKETSINYFTVRQLILRFGSAVDVDVETVLIKLFESASKAHESVQKVLRM